ncbi:MAG: glutaredoxin 3 [Candidatus Paracaedibacteraceae bacterium]|nr:glutaredoxin 3 [Candidatus Paracaedibacteraceae bacterium]
MKNVIYTKPYCPYCVKAEGILKRNNIPYEVVDISIDPILVDEMLKRSGGRKTVPQIFINQVHIGGCDDLEALYLSGGLDKILKK